MEFLKKNKWLIGILAVAFLAPLIYSFIHRILPVVDAQAYDRIAMNLLAGNGFREDATQSFEFDSAIVRAGPGYEFFLAGIYFLFGHHYEAVWVIQALLHALTTLLIFVIARRLFGEGREVASLFAAALFGLSPDLMEISAMLMTETLYLFLIALSLWLFVIVYQSEEERWYSLALGITLAVTVFTRPPVALFVPIILYWYLRHRHYTRAALFLGISAVVVAPWIIRNYLVFHQFIPTTLIGQYNLWVGNTLVANGGQIAGGFNPLTSFAAEHGYSAVKAEAGRQFFQFITTHPLVFVKLCALRFIRFFSLIRPMGFWFYQTGVSQLIFVCSSAAWIIITFWTGFSGSLLAWKKRLPLFSYFLFFAAIAPLVLLPTVVESRYRFQIYPFLALFGGYFAAALINRWPEVRRSGLITAVVLVVISGIDILIFLPTVVERLHMLF